MSRQGVNSIRLTRPRRRISDTCIMNLALKLRPIWACHVGPSRDNHLQDEGFRIRSRDVAYSFMRISWRAGQSIPWQGIWACMREVLRLCPRIPSVSVWRSTLAKLTLSTCLRSCNRYNSWLVQHRLPGRSRPPVQVVTRSKKSPGIAFLRAPLVFHVFLSIFMAFLYYFCYVVAFLRYAIASLVVPNYFCLSHCIFTVCLAAFAAFLAIFSLY